jgi:hypothetical protein
MKRLLKITMVGACYPSSGGRRGWHRSAGFCHAFVEGEARPRYYSEDHCINSIVADLKVQGVDTSEFEQTSKLNLKFS